MVKRGISNDELSKRLNEIGIEETSSSIRNKISRGSFSAAFLNQCLYVMGCDSFEVDAPFNIEVDRVEVYKRIESQIKKNKAK